MQIPDFVIRFFGRRIAEKLDLQGGKMDDSKKWYQSKTIWSGVVSGLIGIYLSLIAAGVHLPAVPAWLITLLSAIGVYGRTTATTTIE